VFATHYHELNELAPLLPPTWPISQVIVEETRRQAWCSLHQGAPGGAKHRSYGIEAASPGRGARRPVVRRARQVLGRIEANSHVAVGLQERG